MAEQTYSRVDLAIEQLDTALFLFLEKQRYVSALTLAGAAEEVLGKALSHQGKQNFLQYKYQVFQPAYNALSNMSLPPWGDFVRNENHARNAAKHMSSSTEATVTVDLEDAAVWMIMRAIDNSKRLDHALTERMVEFINWFFEHKVGV